MKRENTTTTSSVEHDTSPASAIKESNFGFQLCYFQKEF